MPGEAGVTWRPFDRVGFFGGLQAVFGDLNLDNEKSGLEFRFWDRFWTFTAIVLLKVFAYQAARAKNEGMDAFRVFLAQ